MADCANVKIMGADIFRPFVLKEKKRNESAIDFKEGTI
jgi:hypothetical protein